MEKRKTVVFTGGGSGGHVVPAMTLINKLRRRYRVVYIGSIQGIERRLTKEVDIEYFPIPTGKLRRYLSLQNVLDVFCVLAGIIYSFFILIRLDRSTIVVSMGGFVSLPVIVAAYFQRKPILVHEQTSRVGLANRIASFFADKVYVSFEDSLKLFPEDKTIFSGYPVKGECYEESPNNDVICGVDLSSNDKPVIFVTGGGNGSALLNEKVKDELDVLQDRYTVFHQVGKSYFDEYKALETQTYRPFDFLGDGMIDLFKISDVVLSRAGAGTVCELLTLGKRSIFVPLKIAQKNEQLHNACQAQDILRSVVVEEDAFGQVSLISLLESFLAEDVEGERDNPYRRQRGTDFLIKEIDGHYG